MPKNYKIIEHIGTVSLAKSLIWSNSRVMVFFTKFNLKSHASEFIVVGKHTILGWVKFASYKGHLE